MSAYYQTPDAPWQGPESGPGPGGYFPYTPHPVASPGGPPGAQQPTAQFMPTGTGGGGQQGGGGQPPTLTLPQVGLQSPPPTTATNPGIGHWYNQGSAAGPAFSMFDIPTYGQGQFGDYNDPYNLYLSTIPIMEANAQRSIGGAMAAAGGSGTRYSSSALERAGQIGADTALQQNAMLNQLLFNQTNQDLDRQMQATGMMMGLGNQIEQGSLNRLNSLMGFGSWEQGRMDSMADKFYQDFEKNKYGFLPMLLQAAMSQGAGSPGSAGSIAQIMTSPGKEPDIPPEILTTLLRLFL